MKKRYNKAENEVLTYITLSREIFNLTVYYNLNLSSFLENKLSEFLENKLSEYFRFIDVVYEINKKEGDADTGIRTRVIGLGSQYHNH